MGLKEYRAKRRFGKTPEPAGKTARDAGRWRYVIQKHAARRLHYDFRLELDGVLKSWAVPKGPSLDPADKRLAVETEDHPIEYASFEGVIPAGEYGAGRVLLWDRGTWRPVGDPHDGLRRGRLQFELEGEKLHGRWNLVRLAGTEQGDGRQWLLIKGRDEFAARDGDVVAALPRSVASGLVIEEVAADRPKTRSRRGRASKEPGPVASRAGGKAARPARVDPAAVPGARRAALRVPAGLQLATLVRQPPTGEDWIHEMKLDGYRLLCVLADGKARWLSRNRKDWSSKLPALSAKALALPAKAAVLDGELVKLDAAGRSSFQALQNALEESAHNELDYFVFDLLHLDGYDLQQAPLRERKRVLAGLLAAVPAGGHGLRFCDHVAGDGQVVLARACALALEGIVSKRGDLPYAPGRGRSWQKSKCTSRQEFVIAGFTEPQGSRTGIGALLLGVYEDDRLRYAGKVGTGFTTRSLQALHARLRPLVRADSPFAAVPRALPRRGVHWVRPELVCEVEFTEWTEDGRLRHPSFAGMRDDKAARAVRREIPGRAGPPAGAARAAAPAAARRSGATTADGAEVAGVRLTNPDRVLYPEQELTKRELAEFYHDIADWILPHVVDRPLALVRCPEGRQKNCFFQKHASPGMSSEVHRRTLRGGKEPEEVLFIRDIAGLVALVQMGVLEVHVWGSRVSAPEHPDRIVFDLDPDPTADWGQVVEGARLLRDLLAETKLTSLLRTTGGKGLHVVVPLEPRHPWAEVKQFARAISRTIAAAYPDRFTASLPKAQRKGKVFLDYLRNDHGSTAIASYSTRARHGAPVAAPVGWHELGAELAADQFTVANLRRRLARLRRDPWHELPSLRQHLPRFTP